MAHTVVYQDVRGSRSSCLLAWKTLTALSVISVFHGGHLCYSGPGASAGRHWCRRVPIGIAWAMSHVVACEPEPRTIASERAYGDAGRPEPPQILWWFGSLGRGEFRGR